MGLPILVNHYRRPDDMIEDLVQAIRDQYGEYPSPEERSAWSFLGKNLFDMGLDYPLLAETPLFGLERADIIVVDTRNALIIEAKGWKDVRRISKMVVLADGTYHIDPCYQLNNYVSKMRFFHTSGSVIDYRGILFMYNNSTYTSDSCQIAHSIEDLRQQIRKMGEPGKQKDIEPIVGGRFTISDDLIDLIIKYRQDIVSDAASTLVSKGYGLSEEQAMIMQRVFEAVENGMDRTFLIRGESGSGKTLVALELLLDAVKNGYNAMLAYRNNRLLNTMRQVLNLNAGGVMIGSMIQYFSTGRGTGIGEPKFDVARYSDMDLIIYDEAQRMTSEVIQTTQKRSKVKVYFFDDSQILIGDEAGTLENFRRYCKNITEMSLSTTFRLSRDYLKLVRHILWDEDAPKILNYEVKLFDDVMDFMGDLQRKRENGYKIGLLCAFTETRGDKKKPTSDQNRRIGYPLPSGLDIYRDTGLDIHWLMDEKTEYPRYWRGELDPLKYCASVYGAQGFEADYIGLVWGRDLIWRDGWTIDGTVITDTIGNNFSLKSMARRNPEAAMRLIKNRYYTLLTRGIHGVDIFFEDRETRSHVAEILDRYRK